MGGGWGGFAVGVDLGGWGQRETHKPFSVSSGHLVKRTMAISKMYNAFTKSVIFLAGCRYVMRHMGTY